MRTLVNLTLLLANCLFTCLSVKAAEFTKYRDQADKLISQMTLAEKIGQMTQAELSALGDLSDVADLYLGSVLSGGGSDPQDGNSLESWTNAVEACKQKALDTRLRIPILYGIDSVHGHGNVLGAVIFPHNIGLGCARNAELVEQIGQITALEVRATGINWSFSPCITVPRDDRWGRTYEGYSESSPLVAKLGKASIEGLQGPDLRNPDHVLACAKHFVGDGGTSLTMAKHEDWPGFGSEAKPMYDQGDTVVDEEVLRAVHVSPYLLAIQAGVGSIMPSYSSWNGVKCSASKYLLTTMLKEELGFQGFLISDYDAIDQVDPDYKTAIKKCINAGMDMVMVPNNYRQFIELLTELVEEGSVPMSRIDDSVRRILQVKAAMGLLDAEPEIEVDKSLQESYGSAGHREVARQAVRESLVLLKNNNQTLPLSKKLKRLHLVGRGADDIGIQCGGWTIEWQGQAGEVTTGGTTILEGIRQALGDSVEITHDLDGAGSAGADAVVVMVGEMPYAEGLGDDHDLELSESDRQAVLSAKKSGVPIVVVLLSGRPMILDTTLELADAFVAAWLPGTEGAGIADVLFGDFEPTGKLSFTWPREVDQHPINQGDQEYDPLFPFGYGLSYAKDADR
ncbi:glycoside hydrolase family 3 protein [Bythopirellula goksoeyrii]|uniref:beta-glucosidase n=1 Tax=Bythopirellula goksoeyrii TaxID=1400387 RepID=A0A5B9Q953_9BACT|nr:glycoside hydrolase family 3 N-terminal domain-containing protein [Bythopirellula goksoeyrii]QEG33982.1 Periplasmic beta-glucosidase precursor [Bythopirellula goksoeyrii]